MEEKTEEKKIEKTKKKFPRNILFISAGVLAVLIITSLFGYFILENSDWLESKLGLGTNTSTDSDNNTTIVLSEDEKNTSEIVQETERAVVSIAISQQTLTQSQGVVSTSSNIGTGFVIDASGLIITNQHVVSDTSAEYKVVTSDGTEYDVSEIVRDDVNDIALIKIDATDLTILTLGDSDNLIVGQDVIAIGTPLGEYAGSVTKGIISGLHRTVTASADWFGSTSKTYEDVIQTDAAVNSGNSGGPLLNSNGEVVGINFATTSGANDISFALPINIVKSRIEEYRTYGKFIRPYLGVSYQMISEYEALYYSDVEPGAFVVRLDSEGPAAIAGIERGDIITYFGDDQVLTSLSTLIQKHEVGEEVAVKVLRDGQELTITITLAEAD